MRLESLTKVTLGIGALGVGLFAMAFFGPKDLPNEIRDLMLVAGMVAVALGIVMDVVVRSVLQKKVRAQNNHWLEAFYKRSGAQKRAKEENEHGSSDQ